MSARRLTALALLTFGVAGLAGGWRLLPAWILLAGFAWLPGAVALTPCIGACAREGRRCPVAGPAGVPIALAFSLLALVPAVLPLFLLGLDLDASRYTLGVLYLMLGAAGLSLAGENVAHQSEPRGRHEDGTLWLIVAIATAVLLPCVLRYAGGAVDDWWDLAFVRAYIEAPALSFAEPFLASGVAHPRFSWNSWLVLQALVVELGGVDGAGLQARELAGFVCVTGVCAAAGFARSLFAGSITTALAVLVFPLWLYGTEPLPYFVRLHQDKFVAALVLLPAVLAAVIHYLCAPRARMLILVGVCALALSSVHGVITAVALVGTSACVLATWGRGPWSAEATDPLRHWGRLAAALGPAVLYPAWQVLAVRARFASQGIDLEHPDHPVVRAHLALGRLLWPDTLAAIVNPAAVFGPIALVALAGVVLVAQRRRERAARILLALTFVPALLVFVPPLASLAGQAVVPWMLYRFAWLIPVPMLVAFLLAALVDLGQRDRVRAVSAGVVVATVLVIAVVPTARDRIARGMREHPGPSPPAPRGTTLELYRALDALPVAGSVVAPPGLSNLVPALTGRAVVAFSERGTTVFLRKEVEAYRRMRDRAIFLSKRASVAERVRIARRYGVAYAVFRKREVTLREERARLLRASGDGFALERALGWRLWPDRERLLAAALPSYWAVVFENRDYAIVQTSMPLSEPESDAADTSGVPGSLAGEDSSAVPVAWQEGVLGAEIPAVPPQVPISEAILASTAGFPGARVVLDPVPASLGTTDHLVWTAGRSMWDDGPAEVAIRLALPGPCRLTGVEVVPFLQTGRREVLEVEVRDRVVRATARDGHVLRLALEPVVADTVTVRVRSMLGLPFGLADVRLLGDRESCTQGWRPLLRPVLPRASDRALLELSLSRPRTADGMLGWARRRVAAGAAEDAVGLLRRAVRSDPGSARAWVELGLAEDAAGHVPQALSAFRRALEVDSNSAWAHGCMAWAQLRAGNELRALRHATAAARRDPRYADAYTILAGALEAIGMRGLATRFLTRAMALDPRRNWAYLELARMMLEDGRNGEAADLLEAFLERVPDDAEARVMLGRTS